MLGGEGVTGKSRVSIGSFEGVRKCIREGWPREARGDVVGTGPRREREPKTDLRGDRRLALRGGSTASEPSVLVDQRLRRGCGCARSYSSPCEEEEGVLGKEKGEIGLCTELEEPEEAVESMEERGASESVLERGRQTSPYMPERGVSGRAGVRRTELTRAEAKEG